MKLQHWLKQNDFSNYLHSTRVVTMLLITAIKL